MSTQVVLITGGLTGIGRAAAVAFASVFLLASVMAAPAAAQYSEPPQLDIRQRRTEALTRENSSL